MERSCAKFETFECFILKASGRVAIYSKRSPAKPEESTDPLDGIQSISKKATFGGSWWMVTQVTETIP